MVHALQWRQTLARARSLKNQLVVSAIMRKPCYRKETERCSNRFDELYSNL